MNGSGADVVALSLAPDVDTIADAGLITHDWTTAPDKGMVSSSVVVFDVRPGNPKGIVDWNDVARRARGADAGPGIRAAALGGTSCPCGVRRSVATCRASRRMTRLARRP